MSSDVTQVESSAVAVELSADTATGSAAPVAVESGKPAKSSKGKGKGKKSKAPKVERVPIDRAALAKTLRSEPSYLTDTQLAILQVLARSKGPVGRKQIGRHPLCKTSSGKPMLKGFALAFGASTKAKAKTDKYGVQRGAVLGLQPRGLVSCEQVGRSLVYAITAKGRQLIGKPVKQVVEPTTDKTASE